MLGLDADDLLSCKSVCKSWHSLISTSRFINRHLNYSYNKDRCRNELSNRRIILEHDDGGYRLAGSCNGLRIPQPDDARYESTYTSHVEIMNGCLCIFTSLYSSVGGVWLMKNYNVKQLWERLVRRKNYDIVHYLRSPKDESFFNDDASLFLNTSDHHHLLCYRHYIDAPIFVQSLVSPHVNGRPKRDKRSAKWVLFFSFLL
ncbi:hypothetical protein L1987_67372 [Smallanthus sonchifolius]|uniref:Uncharacterized protein n=2 Tax=Smallanthus sonchifolius TaxID=185202 RepID=A0ACB9B1W9_9ASTR|nr:hypothetical protein L1987_67367 [Smallanthus sonchifolius]KAI3716471.1 hypothetical protein L1987_67372 [Smallanthus sonchifolius]